LSPSRSRRPSRQWQRRLPRWLRRNRRSWWQKLRPRPSWNRKLNRHRRRSWNPPHRSRKCQSPPRRLRRHRQRSNRPHRQPGRRHLVAWFPRRCASGSKNNGQRRRHRRCRPRRRREPCHARRRNRPNGRPLFRQLPGPLPPGLRARPARLVCARRRRRCSGRPVRRLRASGPRTRRHDLNRRWVGRVHFRRNRFAHNSRARPRGPRSSIRIRNGRGCPPVLHLAVSAPVAAGGLPQHNDATRARVRLRRRCRPRRHR